ncbi:GMC oxidoreductase [Peniophora sp. CONT]|nr:GMC oxidoreductase [Peniophora sp. CONT]
MLSLAFLIWLLPGYVLSTIHDTIDDLNESTWDYIVIGGGTAGSVLASRLSKNANASVLVIEAGGRNDGPSASALQVPFFVSNAGTGTSFDWNYTTVPQAALNNRTLTYPRGFVLGGSSSTNYMAFTRCASDDYDRLASTVGDAGWSWDAIVPYHLKSEQHVASSDKHDTTGQYNPAWHGTGPVLTSLPGNPSGIDGRVIATTKELGDAFPFVQEMNNGNPLGIGWLQSTIGNSVRSSAATAYLSLDISARSNLDILINTHATRLVQTATLDGVPEFKAVEVAVNSSAPRVILTARQEVILSAGSVGTPQLLMLSGIGAASELTALGINTTVDSPEVGKSLQDHPYLAFQWAVNSTDTFDSVVNNSTLFADTLAQYENSGTGLFSDNPIANQIGFFRLPDNSSILAKYGDATSGPGAPHFEFAFANGYVGTESAAPTTGNFMSVAVVLVAPTSRGSLVLNSASPFDAPLIDPAFLSTDMDVETFVAAVQTLNTFVAADAWKGYIIGPAEGSPDYSSAQSIATYVRKNAISIRHPVSTARIADLETGKGVLNADLTVRGVRGLRVVDASVLPYIPAGHPQAVVYALAERAVDLIAQS